MEKAADRHQKQVSPNRFLCEHLESRTLFSTASLVKDINPGTFGSGALPLGHLGALTLFLEDDGIHGEQLYRTDGTPAGTSSLTSFPSGVSNVYLVGAPIANGITFGNKLFMMFRMSDGTDALWQTDGTAAGTTQVKSYSGAYFNPDSFLATTSKFFFVVKEGGLYGDALYESDGTSAGTIPFGQAFTGANGMVIFGAEVLNNKLYYAAGYANQINLFSTDGTNAGTTLIKSSAMYAYTVNPSLFSVGSKALLTVPNMSTVDLWSSDGTSANTTTIKTYNSVATVGSGSAHAFLMGQSATDSTLTLYSTDGTAAGTTLVKSGFQGVRNNIGTLANGSVLFEAETSGSFSLFRSDGTSAGTLSLAPVDTKSAGAFSAYQAGTVDLFDGYDATNGNLLWKTDGTAAGTMPISISRGVTAGPSNFLAGNPFYFSDDDGIYGQELWKSDGTAAGTQLVADIGLQGVGSTPQAFSDVNGKLWFAANDAIHGFQPWTSDGTAAGTVQVSADASLSFAHTAGFVGLGAKVFFTGQDATGTYRLFSSTGSGVTLDENTAGFPQATAAEPVIFNNAAYFIGSDGSTTGIWKSDGTPAGTSLVSNDPAVSSASALIVAGNHLFVNGQVSGAQQIFSIDTNNVLSQVTNVTSLEPLLGATTVVNGLLYYIVRTSAGVQLWHSDGTAGNTTMVKQLNQSTNDAYHLATLNDAVYLTVAFDNGYNNINTTVSLYRSDGTADGTTLVDMIDSNFFPDQLVAAGGNVFFVAGNNNNSPSVWASDGTAANTHTVMPNADYSSHPYRLTAVGNLVYFANGDTTHGQELWYSDGTVAGTSVIDINPGTADGVVFSNNGSPAAIAHAGDNVFVQATTYFTGAELYRVNNPNNITATSGSDTITLTQSADHAHIDWTVGTASGELLTADPLGLTINGNGGSDIITLSGSNPLPATLHLNGTFTLNGLAGTNPLANTTLDIGSSTVFVKYANAAADPLSALRGYLSNGYNTGQWNGKPTATTGVILSTAAASVAAHNMGIGYADSADGLVTLLANTIELKYTLYGDTGLTGSVGFTDFMRMTQHYTLASGGTWGMGDFNYDGIVNSADFNLLQPNYGQSLPAMSVAPGVMALTSGRPGRSVYVPPAVAVAALPATRSVAIVPAIATAPLLGNPTANSKHHLAKAIRVRRLFTRR